MKFKIINYNNILEIQKYKTFLFYFTTENEVRIFSFNKKKKIFWRLNRNFTKRYFNAK